MMRMMRMMKTDHSSKNIIVGDGLDPVGQNVQLPQPRHKATRYTSVQDATMR